jgi:hypothetical protein
LGGNAVGGKYHNSVRVKPEDGVELVRELLNVELVLGGVPVLEMCLNVASVDTGGVLHFRDDTLFLGETFGEEQTHRDVGGVGNETVDGIQCHSCIYNNHRTQ